MRNEGAITNLDDVQAWFEMNQKQGDANKYFSIFRGAEQNASKIIFRNETVADPDAAWEMMQEVLEMHIPQGGIYRLYITSKPKFNVGFSTLFKAPSPNMSTQNMAGIGNLYGIHGNIQEYVSAELAKERKMWELEQLIRNMKMEQDAKVGEMDRMMEEFTPVLKDLAHKFGMKIMGYGPAPMPPTSQPAAPPMAGHTTDTLPPEGFDYDRVEPALDGLRRVFPDTETTLEKLSAWAQQNPETAQQLLQNLG